MIVTSTLPPPPPPVAAAPQAAEGTQGSTTTTTMTQLRHADNETQTQHQQQHHSLALPRRNVTFAINYEVSLVDEFVPDSATRRRRHGRMPGSQLRHQQQQQQQQQQLHRPNMSKAPFNDSMEGVEEQNAEDIEQSAEDLASDGRGVNSRNENDTDAIDTDGSTTSSHSQHVVGQQQEGQSQPKRRSARDKGKRELNTARARVRYDMQAVPAIKRNKDFLDTFPLWWMMPPAGSGSVDDVGDGAVAVSKLVASTTPKYREENTPPNTMNNRNGLVPGGSCECNTPIVVHPFDDEENNSVVWIPSKRSEWEDTVGEMTAVCTSAAIRREVLLQKLQGGSPSTTKRPFHAPLSRDYIRDRIDIDDPLNGYQIRHKTGGWLQGFVLWTNFTTWTHYFKWDSLDPRSGLPTATNNGNEPLPIDTRFMDADGSLAAELEQCPRSGDPMEGGIVFNEIAEIALLGGLGCGEYLLRMALESIRRKGHYKFVVLQATDSSKSFYERYGFVRVGAVCRYAASTTNTLLRKKSAPPAITNGEPGTAEVAVEETQATETDQKQPEQQPQPPIVGYRHWTHANESETSLQAHGGPSYMMCLKLPSERKKCCDDKEESAVCPVCGVKGPKRRPLSFLDAMLTLLVDKKPTIEQLGASSTPAPGPRKRQSIGNAASTDSMDSSSVAVEGFPKKGSGNRGSSKRKMPPAVEIGSSNKAPRVGTRLNPAPDTTTVDTSVLSPTPKRRKIASKNNKSATNATASLPLGSRELQHQSQQQHVTWLGVDGSLDLPSVKPTQPQRSLHKEPKSAIRKTRAASQNSEGAQAQEDEATSSLRAEEVDTPPLIEAPNVDSATASTKGRDEFQEEESAKAQSDADASGEPLASLAGISSPATLAPPVEQVVGDPTQASLSEGPAADTTTRMLPPDSTSDVATENQDGSATTVTHIPGGTATAPSTSESAEATPSGRGRGSSKRRNSALKSIAANKGKTPTKKKSPRPAVADGSPIPESTAKRKKASMATHLSLNLDSAPATQTRERLKKAAASSSAASSAAPVYQDEDKDRPFYSVRGSDGRFVRVSELESPPTLTTSTPSKTKAASHAAIRREVSMPAKKAPTPSYKPVDKSTLTKQKVKSYPRSRVHYFNRVVKHVDGTNDYFFVLNYDEDKNTIIIVPMAARGKLTGKREGRPRYQAVIGDDDSNFKLVPCSDYEVVPATMVMKTPFVAQEAWDIEDD